MKAISQQIVGGPDVLQVVEVDTPRPGAGEVLIRVVATSINAADWKARRGIVDRLGPPPFTLGLDVSGVVTEIGDGVCEFRPGDAVFGMAMGANAEYVVAPVTALAPKPEHLDHVHAAALPTAALTAWQALSGVGPGDRVLIHAAAGGVGHLAVQIAKSRAAYVIGTARAANHGYLRELGADEVIDYTTTDFGTALELVDVVLDLVGGDYGSRSGRVLKPGGRLIDAQGNDAAGDPRYDRFYVQPSGAQLREITALVATGRLRVRIDRVMSLAEVAEAHRLSESGHVRGKVVLTAWETPADLLTRS
ncbi:NADP-dependent oxidoreductase [Nocardia carnea]|uniref:NADP-dependent oxidoreductase n=1 Tax=Nocardia carnea TaxID=37328 RepID=UPI0024547746|nr:NADP-dependent oxidoreductase [Nocardia carnea]